MAAPVHLSKLTSVLKQLSETEMERLESFLQSPYFDVPTGALPLFQYLSKLHPVYDEKKTAAEFIQKKAPALGNQKRQANYGSDLLKAIEHFLAVEDFKATTDSVDRHRLQAYKKHHMFEAFNKEQDIDVFYQRHILTELALTGFDANLNRTAHNQIHPVATTLNVFYAIKKLRYYCELLNRQRVLGIPYNEDNIQYLLEVLEPYNNERYPYVYLFVSVYKMLKAVNFEEGETYYQPLHAFIETLIADSLPQCVKETIVYAINYNQYWNNRGYKNAGKQALWWNELKIKYDLLLEHDTISPADFRFIVSLAIATDKEHGWIKNFIETYVYRLPREHFDTNSAFAWAQYYYATANYKKAMPLFQQAQAKDEAIFNAIVRRWQFMCMYEENPGDIDLLSTFLDTYEKYIQRNAASFHQYKEVFEKNIQFGKKLIKVTDAVAKNKLKVLVEAEPYFPGKEWFIKLL